MKRIDCLAEIATAEAELRAAMADAERALHAQGWLDGFQVIEYQAREKVARGRLLTLRQELSKMPGKP